MQWWPVLVALLAMGGTQSRADTLAVLPFWNQGNAAPSATNVDWIGESIAEMVRESVGAHSVLGFERDEVQDAIHRLHLHDRMPLSQASVIKIGEELDAEQILFGSFVVTPAPKPAANAKIVSAGSLKITARVLDRRHMRLGAEFVETGALEDLATIEAHLAWRTLALVAPQIAPPEADFKTLKVSIRLDAEESYVRGLLARDPAQKEKFYLQAARLDARFAHPCFQLGRIHYDRKEYRQAVDWLEKVSPDDIHYRAASFLLGLARYQTGDFPGAQKAFQTIAETVPLGEVYNNLGAVESRRNLPQAVDDFRKALAGDETDSVYQFNLGYALWKRGDFGEAADHFRAVLDREPDDQVSTVLLGRCLKKQGLHAGAATGSDARLTGIERLKANYQERAYWQLKAVMGK